MDLVHKQLLLIRKISWKIRSHPMDSTNKECRFSNGNEEHGCYESITSYAI